MQARQTFFRELQQVATGKSCSAQTPDGERLAGRGYHTEKNSYACLKVTNVQKFNTSITSELG
jgi:hypothetical protein